MIIRLPAQQYRGKQDRVAILYFSDSHIGARDCDIELLKEDLDWAAKHNAIVLGLGDIHDLIFPKDSKRFRPSQYAPEILATDNVLNATLDLAEDVLAPYAHLIHMLACGNHETAVSAWHGSDMTALLIERLQMHARVRKPSHRIWHGAYTGGIVIPFRRNHGGGTLWRIHYHHGAGGGAPVTKGMIDFNRLAAQTGEVDVLWMGHKHTCGVYKSAQWRIPSRGNTMAKATQWYLRTGAYTGGHLQQLDDRGTYASNYAIERMLSPEGRGGVRMLLSPRQVTRGGRGCVAQIKATVEL